jgi:bacterioferritin
MSDFIMDIEAIRKEARRGLDEGAVTEHYRADREAVIKMLDAAVATEWLCVLRYTQHSLAAQGLHAESVAAHFAEHAKQEQEHAMALSERIKQLGGTPNLDPSAIAARSHTVYKQSDDLIEMIKENLIAERIAVAVYSENIRYINDTDPTTRRLLESILEVEEEHADELADLLVGLNGRGKLN